MADQTATVEAQVVQTPVTTPVVTTPIVNTTPAPEPDLLTKISQFKLPEQDKIVNPPEQPEFSAITDPVAKKAAAEAVERMRRGMQADYTKKLEDAQRIVNQSKSWTPQRIQQELLSNPEFLQAAQMIQGSQPANQPTDAYSALNDVEKAKVDLVPALRNELQQIKNQNFQQQLNASINQKDLALRQKYGDLYDSLKVNQAAERFGTLTPADAREYIFLADNATKMAERAYEVGKLEGQGKLQNKLNVITPGGISAVSNEGVPTRNAKESTESYFARIGAFRLAQFKNQK